MSLFSRLNGGQMTDTRDSLWDVLGPLLSGTKTSSGKHVDEDTAFKYSTFYACVALISESIAMLNVSTYTEDEEGRQTTAPTPNWLRDPMVDLGRFWVNQQLLMGMLMHGDGYAQILRRPSDGTITGYVPLHPLDVQCEWDPNRFGFRRYSVKGGPWVDGTTVLHIPGLMKTGEPNGISVLGAAREAVGLGLTQEEFGAKFFARGSVMSGVIQVPGKLDTDQAKIMIDSFARRHSGADNWHKPGLLSGAATYQPITIAPNDAQFLESREFQAIDIARWFRVPPHRVNIMTKQTTWGSGIEQENRALVDFTLLPWIIRLEAGLTAYTAGGAARGTKVKVDTKTLLRGSTKERYESYKVGLDAGFLVPDEPRAWEGLAPLPNGEGAKPKQQKVTAPPPEPNAEETGASEEEPDDQDE